MENSYITGAEKATAQFDVLWNLGEFEEAVRIYFEAGRPFWLAEEVACYFESMGKFAESRGEWQHLIDSYFAMGESLLPLLNYPQEVFLLGVWHASTDKARAVRYLSEYVRVADQWGRFPPFHLLYKNTAKRILSRLNGSKI